KPCRSSRSVRGRAPDAVNSWTWRLLGVYLAFGQTPFVEVFLRATRQRLVPRAGCKLPGPIGQGGLKADRRRLCGNPRQRCRAMACAKTWRALRYKAANAYVVEIII